MLNSVTLEDTNYMVVYCEYHFDTTLRYSIPINSISVNW